MVAPLPSCGPEAAGSYKQLQHILGRPRFLGTGLLLFQGARDAGHIVYSAINNEQMIFRNIELPRPTADEIAFEASMDFSNQVVAHCSEKNISFVDLAAKLGIKPSTLSEKLNGQNLTLKSMAAMALALDCKFEAPRLVDE